jgi:NAD(P)-dependent dehydrogenase (short-subunit alcohol dehydrogenase family)
VSDAEPAGAGDGGESGAGGATWTPAALSALRADPRRRAVALVVGAAVGLGLAWVHWLGLFAAGALVGLVSRTLPRAIVAGVAVGVVVLLATVLAAPAMSAGEFLSLSPPAYVAVAAGIVAPAWGSLVRGVV